MPETVLVCSHERHVVRLIQVNLERQGRTVTTAFGGAEGIELLRKWEEAERRPFDRVVVEGLMPEVDGYEVLRWIRNSHHERIWVAVSLPENLVEEWMAREHRADRYMTEPFDPHGIFR